MGPEPAFDLVERHALADGVVLDLVGSDAADREVAHLRMPEVDAADARRRNHGGALRKRDADVLGTEQVEELPLLAVGRTGGIPEGRPDAAKTLRNQLFGRELVAVLVPLLSCD